MSFGELELLDSTLKDGVRTNTYEVSADIEKEWVNAIRLIRETQADEFTFILCCKPETHNKPEDAQ